jgi:hypothetical protein
MKHSGEEEDEVLFGFAYYIGQKDLINDLLKNINN